MAISPAWYVSCLPLLLCTCFLFIQTVLFFISLVLPEHLVKIAKNPTFFDHEGHTHLDNLKQNELKEVGDKMEFYEGPLNEARHNRLKAFDGAMQPVLNTSLAEHNFEGLYDPAEEELIQVLNVNELIGLPSSTDEIHVKGSIGVALLRPRRGMIIR